MLQILVLFLTFKPKNCHQFIYKVLMDKEISGNDKNES